MSVTFAKTLRAVVTAGALFASTAYPSPGRIVNAAPPHVMIDVGTTVECHEVTSPEFAAAHPTERIVAAKFRLSVLLDSGREQDLEQLQVTIVSPEQRLRVVDFQPRTELTSELAGDVEVCHSDDTIKSLNASMGGVVAGDHGPAHVQVSPAAGVGVTLNHGSKETFHRLSPKQLVLASGTTHAEHGVFFKWRRTSQATLEGAREVTCHFLVPHDWRGDWVQVSCDSVYTHRNYFGEKLEPCGGARALVGLYLSGDAAAEQAAHTLASLQFPPAVGPAASERSSPQRHVAYKPSDTPNRRTSPDWFSLPSLFKLCDHQRETSAGQVTTAAKGVAVAARPDLPTALDELRNFSGTRP